MYDDIAFFILKCTLEILGNLVYCSKGAQIKIQLCLKSNYQFYHFDKTETVYDWLGEKITK